MGLPFRSDHYLALRHFPANTFGRPYHFVRHRGSDATWVLDEGTPISASCTGHSDAAISAASMVDISIMWTGPCRLSLEVRGALVWNIELQRTQDRANDWRRSADAARDVGPPRGARRDGMGGRTGSRSRASSAGGDCAGRSVVQGEPAPDPEHRRQPAVVDEVDVGPPGPLLEQTRLGDCWLPRRGIFSVGETSVENFDPARHHARRPATRGATR